MEPELLRPARDSFTRPRIREPPGSRTCSHRMINNSGVTWTNASLPTNYWMSVASSTDGSHLIAVSLFDQGPQNPGVIWRSTNSGGQLERSCFDRLFQFSGNLGGRHHIGSGGCGARRDLHTRGTKCHRPGCASGFVRCHGWRPIGFDVECQQRRRLSVV